MSHRFAFCVTLSGLWFDLDVQSLREGAMSELTDQPMATIKDAAKKLTGAKRRAFQAQVVLDYLTD